MSDVIIVPSGGTMHWVSGQTVTFQQTSNGLVMSKGNLYVGNSAANQLTLSYDTSTYGLSSLTACTFNVASNGITTINTFGSNPNIYLKSGTGIGNFRYTEGSVEVNGPSDAYAQFFIKSQSTGGHAAKLYLQTNSAATYAQFDMPDAGGGTAYYTSPNNLTISVPADWGMVFNTSGKTNNGITINKYGYVGVGVSPTLGMFEINRASGDYGSTKPLTVYKYGSNEIMRNYMSATWDFVSDLSNGSGTNANFIFKGKGTGYFGIGLDAPASLLHIRKDSGTTIGMFIDNASVTANSTKRLSFGSAGSEYAYLDLNGNTNKLTLANTSPSVAHIYLTPGTGGNLIVDSGNVGIGTLVPSAKLHISGSTIIQSNSYTNGLNLQTFLTTQQAGIRFHDIDTPKWSILKETNNTFYFYNHTTSTYSIKMETNDAITLSGNTISLYDKVGIGTLSPLDTLHVSGSTIIQSNSTGLKLQTFSASQASGIEFFDTNVKKWVLYKETNNDFYLYNDVTGKYPIRVESSNDSIRLSGTTISLYGSVGIGTLTPGQLLVVSGGTIQITRTGTETAGYVLTTNSAGEASWTAPPNSLCINATCNADGFSITGGTVKRILTVYGADVNITGSTTSSINLTGEVSLWGDVNNYVGIGNTPSNAKFEIFANQSNDGGKAALKLHKNLYNVDDPFIIFSGVTSGSTAHTGSNISTDQGDGTVDGPKTKSSVSGWAFSKMIKININGEELWISAFRSA